MISYCNYSQFFYWELSMAIGTVVQLFPRAVPKCLLSMNGETLNQWHMGVGSWWINILASLTQNNSVEYSTQHLRGVHQALNPTESQQSASGIEPHLPEVIRYTFLAHICIAQLVLPMIISQRNYFHSNPCLRIWFWGRPT